MWAVFSLIINHLTLYIVANNILGIFLTFHIFKFFNIQIKNKNLFLSVFIFNLKWKKFQNMKILPKCEEKWYKYY
jgi:hypothetical protein